MDPNPYQSPNEPTGGPKKSWLIVAAEILLVMLIVGIAGWMLVDMSSKPRESAERDARAGS